MAGDQETAQFFYDHAREAGGANATVGVATRRTEEGKKLFTVAADSDTKVESKVAQEHDALRRSNDRLFCGGATTASWMNRNHLPPRRTAGGRLNSAILNTTILNTKN